MAEINGVAEDQLRSIVERIERLSEEKVNIANDIKEVYAEAKGNGFDTKALKQLISLRKIEQDDLAQQEAILDLYRTTLGV